MTGIVDTINKYFIEMVDDVEAKKELEIRMTVPLGERQLNDLPKTKSMRDAFYVAIGVRFQDSPTKTLIIILGFLGAVGFTLANLITRFMG